VVPASGVLGRHTRGAVRLSQLVGSTAFGLGAATSGEMQLFSCKHRHFQLKPEPVTGSVLPSSLHQLRTGLLLVDFLAPIRIEEQLERRGTAQRGVEKASSEPILKPDSSRFEKLRLSDFPDVVLVSMLRGERGDGRRGVTELDEFSLRPCEVTVTPLHAVAVDLTAGKVSFRDPSQG